MAGDGSGMGSLDASRETASGLHDLPTGVMNGSSAVVDGADEGEFVGDFCVTREDFRDVDVG